MSGMWLGSNIYFKFYILICQSSELALRNRDKDSLNFFFFLTPSSWYVQLFFWPQFTHSCAISLLVFLGELL